MNRYSLKKKKKVRLGKISQLGMQWGGAVSAEVTWLDGMWDVCGSNASRHPRGHSSQAGPPGTFQDRRERHSLSQPQAWEQMQQNTLVSLQESLGNWQPISWTASVRMENGPPWQDSILCQGPGPTPHTMHPQALLLRRRERAYFNPNILNR